MPPQPKAFPDMPADPSFQSEDWATILSQSVVAPPASYILPPVVSQLVAGLTLAASPFFSYFRLESLQAFRRYFDLPLAVQSESQELAFPGPSYPAFLGIHLQSQMLLDPSPDRRHHPFTRRFTAYVNVAVIRVSAELVTSLFQF